MNKRISIFDSLVLKGVALCLLLIHHLFWISNGLYDDITVAHHGIVNELGKSSKLCVAIFVFLSGYGLMSQTEHTGGIENVWSYYRHRLLKLFINYWVIWILFVPIGIFCFHRTFEDVYRVNILLQWLADVLGLAFVMGFYGYNATWWFMSCIIVLYLLFPVLYKITKNSAFIVLLASNVLALLPVPVMQYEIIRYMLPFILGMTMASNDSWLRMGESKSCFILLTISIILFIERGFVTKTVVIDCLLCIAIVATYISLPKYSWMESAFAFMGKHSMNIFLFHTFIFSHWFKEIIYSPRNPFLIFCFLLFVCLLVSLFIEKIKQWSGVQKMLKSV